MRPRGLAVLLSLFAVTGLSGCGQARQAAPQPVPVSLAPTALLHDSLHLYRNTAPDTLAAFHEDRRDALISDGKLWEIRRVDRLIGTLEIATVKPDVNLAKSSVRDSFTAPILVGSKSDIRLAGQEVETVQSDDGVGTVVWFGKGLFEVLQVKDTIVTGAQLAQAVIEFQQTQAAWAPLPQLYSPV
ncbi:MAG TPA: hypothetical protein VFH54_09140 [Mycobacteriales bacterium]|nr:hypothetical protein [Mycobacteriales bacterium]